MGKKTMTLLLVAVLGLGTVAQAANIIWVGDNKGYGDVEPNMPADQGWIDLLTSLGHDVHYPDQHNTEDGTQRYRTLDPNKIAELEAADLVIMSRNTDSGSYSSVADNEPNQWNAISTPIISLSAHLMRSNKWGMLNSTGTAYTMGDTHVVADASSVIFDGVAVDANGMVDVVLPDYNVDAVTDITDAGNGRALATRASDGFVMIATWEAGQAYYEGSAHVAGGARMFFAAGAGSKSSVPDGVYNLTADGEIMFINAVNYMLMKNTQVVLVSFHGGDSDPHPDAVEAGFTEAPDRGYSDLLQSAGYSVSRYITNSDPDVELLNAADLVLISRSVNSGDYSNDGATRWNSVSAPMIIMGGYPLRNSRMGYTTGGTMIDTDGDISLTVMDPEHPIFEGIALTDGTMDNLFASIVTYPTDANIVARGVSINTDPIDDEGVVLAQISEAGGGPIGGMVIGEWQAGAELTHAGGAETDILAGNRLVFLTGSRETSGITSRTAGLYDLYEDGAQMLLNAVAYMIPKPVIADVARLNGVSGDRDPIGAYEGDTAPLPSEAEGLVDGAMVFSDRTYPWANTPVDLIGAEYIRTFNSDKNGGTVDVTYTVSLSQAAVVGITVDDRIPAEWDAVASQQEAADRVAAFVAPGTFADSGLDLFIRERDDGTRDRGMSVFTAELEAGTYSFGSMDSGKNFYTILVLP
jgi:hypothetical protein